MKTYIKEIVILVIMSKVILSMIPKKAYYKYVKLFLGVLMIIVMLKPVDYFINMSGKIESYIDDINFISGKNEFEESMQLSDELIKYNALKSYKEIIKNDIKNIVENEDFDCRECEVEFSEDTKELENITVYMEKQNSGSIDKVVIDIWGGDKNSYVLETADIKWKIMNKYNVKEENIIIVYEEG